MAVSRKAGRRARTDLGCIDVSPCRHLEVRGVIVRNRRPDRIREGVVGRSHGP
jgi:hypothetical protein